MRILLDGSLLTVGGGVQVGLAILDHAARTPSIEWHAVLSRNMDAQLPTSVRSQLTTVTAVAGRCGLRFRQLDRRLAEIESKLKPDLVFTIFGPSTWHARAPHLQGFALPNLIYPEVTLPELSLRTRVWRHLHYILNRSLTKSARFLVVETQTVKDRLHTHLGIPYDRVFVVRNSFSRSFESALASIPRRTHDGPFVFAVPSSYYVHKNLEFVPHVAQCLSNLTTREFQFSFTLPEDTATWSKIVRIATELGVRRNLKSVGSVPHAEFATVYRSADAVFLPTLLECSSAVYPETFLAELPLVTSATDFAKELCEDAAVYIDPRNPVSTAHAVLSLMEDGGLRSFLIERGRDALKKNYLTPEEKWKAQVACMLQVQQSAQRHCGLSETPVPRPPKDGAIGAT